MILNDAHILNQQEKNKIIEPFNMGYINAASYDIAVSHEWICPETERKYIASRITLRPGECILGCSVEYVRLPDDIAANFKLKSSLGRLFLNHTLAGWIDPGFCGRITLEFQNIGPHARILEAGTRVGQLVFMQTTGVAEISPYKIKGHYQNQDGVETSWNESYFRKAE